MSSLNKAQIIGNLGSDPEIRSTSSGTRVATLSVATNRTYENRAGDEVDETQWHRVILWRRMAEVAEEYLSKGDRVYVEGRIEYREWEGDDGKTRYTTEIVGRRLLMLGGGSRSGGRSGPPPREEGAPGGGGQSKDDKQLDGAESGDDWGQGDFGEFPGDDDLPF